MVTFFGFSEEKKPEDIIDKDKENDSEDIDNTKSEIVNYSIYNCVNSLFILFQKDKETFFDYIKFLLINCSYSYEYKSEKTIELDIYKIIFLLMKKNLEEAIKIFPKLLSLINIEKLEINNDREINGIKKQKYSFNLFIKSKYYLTTEINFIKKQIIKYLFNQLKHNIIFELNIMDESHFFSDLNTSLYFLNDIKEREACLFIINKIKELSLVDSNIKLFIEFIKMPINNQFIFEHLLNSIKEEEKENLFFNNKDIVIKSLFSYSEINGYYFIQKIINFIAKYMSKDEIKNIIIFNFNNKEEGIINNNELTDEVDEFWQDINIFGEVNENKKNELLFYKEKYLFFYSIFNRKIINYETIATLFEYCPSIPLILYLFPFLKTNLKEIFSFKIINYISYFSIQKNKEKIKELSKNFYNLSLFFESIISNIESINSFDIFQKKLFVYYIQILILEIILDMTQKIIKK